MSVFRDGTEEYDICVQLDQSFRKNQSDMASLFIYYYKKIELLDAGIRCAFSARINRSLIAASPSEP